MDENINKKLSIETELAKELLDKYQNYHKLLSFLAADAPLWVLMLPKNIEKVLGDFGIERIYDLIGCDFGKIKGLSTTNRNRLTSKVNEFLSML